jgi:hypothetical protein
LIKAEGKDAIILITFPLVTALSVAFVLWSRLRTPMAWALVAAFAISFVMMFSEIRMNIYVIWLGLPFVGIAAQLLAERTPHVALVRTAAVTLASPAVVSLLAAGLTASAATKQLVKTAQDLAACVAPAVYHTLAALKPGLVLAHLDLGPTILADTPHSIIAAPYHRADAAIRFNQEIMEGPRDVDASRVIDRGVDYVVVCTGYAGHVIAGSFQEALLTDKTSIWLTPVSTPDGDIVKVWLTPVPTPDGDMVKIWRVVR